MTELREMPSSLNDACRKLDAAYAEIESLRAALKPFALRPGAVSLSKAMGHITREDLIRANDAYQQGVKEK